MEDRYGGEGWDGRDGMDGMDGRSDSGGAARDLGGSLDLQCVTITNANA